MSVWLNVIIAGKFDGFRPVVAVVELEGLQALLTAIEQPPLNWNGRSGYPPEFQSNGDKPHQSLPSIIQRAKSTTTLSLRHNPSMKGIYTYAISKFNPIKENMFAKYDK